MVNLKTGVSRKQSTPKFPKKKHFFPPDMHTHVLSGGLTSVGNLPGFMMRHLS